ncbi:MAG: protein-L-isoaspartate O-methyltransferase family protein [Alphaproteobacteria bacterium]
MFSEARKNMVDGQIHTASVTDPNILQAFETVPREVFVPEKLKNVAYTDANLDLGQGRYLLDPIVYARMLQFCAPHSDDVALDVASGSGYSSIILSRLVKTVISLEKNKRQRDKCERVIQSLNVCNVMQVDGGITLGADEYAPYSLIVINGAVSEVPAKILNQLDVGGRLICVLKSDGCSKGTATLFSKSQSGNVSMKVLFDASVPVLAEFAGETEFAL